MSSIIKKLNLKVKQLFSKANAEQTDAQSHSRLNNPPTDKSESVCCRICEKNSGKELLFNPCSCVGSSAFIHRKCLSVWFHRARYDVLCCECKSRYIRIKYRHNANFLFWLKEEPTFRNYIIIGSIMFPFLLSIVIYGCIKAAMSDTNDLFKVLFVPTMAFGALTVWKLVGYVAIVINEYNAWKTLRLNTTCDHKHSNTEKNK